MTKRFLSIGLLAAALALFTLAAACDNGGDDGASEEEIQAVEDILRQVFESGPDEADFFFGHVTDNLIETVAFSTREECEADFEECIGEASAVEGISDTKIDGGSATSVVAADFGTFDVGLVREDEVWKLDRLQAASDDVPEGAVSVDLRLSEFAFDFDESAIPADGNLVFRVDNAGQQVHEVIVVEVAPEGELEEALDSVSEEEPPAGFKVFILPDQQVNMAFEGPLQPGRYALVCFFPDTDDPEFTPHVDKGMVSEFTIE